MATPLSAWVPSSPGATTLFTATIGAAGTQAVTIGPRAIFKVVCAADANIRFGNATKVPTATAADYPLWAKVEQVWETGDEFDRVSLFSTAGGVFWLYVVSRN